MVKTMAGETPLLLQVKDEGPDFVMADLSYIRAYALWGEEVLEVTYAVGDDGDSIWAFSFSGGTELVSCDKAVQRY